MADLVNTVEDKVAKANALKDQGNEFLKNHKYSSAAEKYSEAIEINPTAIFYSNRAQAMIKLESYGLAIQDANEALKYADNLIYACIDFTQLIYPILIISDLILNMLKLIIAVVALTSHWGSSRLP